MKDKRSAAHFAIFIAFALAAVVFVLDKAREAVREVQGFAADASIRDGK